MTPSRDCSRLDQAATRSLIWGLGHKSTEMTEPQCIDHKWPQAGTHQHSMHVPSVFPAVIRDNQGHAASKAHNPAVLGVLANVTVACHPRSLEWRPPRSLFVCLASMQLMRPCVCGFAGSCSMFRHMSRHLRLFPAGHSSQHTSTKGLST